MPNPQAEQVVAAALPFLQHPDGGAPYKLAPTIPHGKPGPIREQAGNHATRMAQSIVHAIESAGGRIDFGPAPTDPGHQIQDTTPLSVEVLCGLCGQKITGLTVRDPSIHRKNLAGIDVIEARISAPQWLAGLAQIPTDCGHVTAPNTHDAAAVAYAHGANLRQPKE